MNSKSTVAFSDRTVADRRLMPLDDARGCACRKDAVLEQGDPLLTRGSWRQYGIGVNVEGLGVVVDELDLVGRP